MGNSEGKSPSVDPKTSVSFTLNGAPVEVQGVSPSLTLNSWLRTQPGLAGTKIMCGEGGCGCCVVSVSLTSPVTQQDTTFAVNSVRKNPGSWRRARAAIASYIHGFIFPR